MSPIDENEDTFDEFQTWTRDADLTEGTHIDRYQILGLIGKGGMGAVYKAYDPELDRSIAIKILTALPQEGETASRPQARLMREAQALAKLNHPNVVAVHDVGTYVQGVYIAMEYVKGKTLREWLIETKPARKEIIEVFLNAGQGLQAAHSEGIVHRDFKPENVLVGDKGQVKVLDFGLARALGLEDISSAHPKPEPILEPTSGESLLSAPLTREGARIGTTVYMAPEHFLGQELDEKTDQFSFCVSLFEALYGQRPIPGKTAHELQENLTTGAIEIPVGAEVPNWIEEIILKGLSVSKEDRHAAISDLLHALQNDPELIRSENRKRQRLVLAFFLSAILFMGAGYLLFSHSDELCSGADRKLAGIWNPDKKEQIRLAFTSTGVSFADDSFVRMEKRLLDYLQKWKKEFTQTCEATRLRGEQSERFMDLKMNCLNRLLRHAGALISVFSEADKTVVAKSVQAVSSLSGHTSCSDTDALLATIPPPKDKQTKDKIDDIRERLVAAEAFYKTGKYREGLNLVQKLHSEADAVDYRPLQAEVSYWFGVLLNNTGEYKKAEKYLYDAARSAGISRDGLLVVKAMSALVWVVGHKQARHIEGLSLGRATEIFLGVTGGGELVLAMLFNNVGAVFEGTAKYDQALDYYRKSLAIRKKELGLRDPVVAASLNNMGNVHQKQGNFDKALEYHHKALLTRKEALGPEHPDVAMSYNNLGVVLEVQGKFGKALQYYQQSLTIWEQALGSKHPNVAYALHNIASMYAEQNQLSKALTTYRRAATVFSNQMGSDHPELVYELSGIGEILLNKEDHWRLLLLWSVQSKTARTTSVLLAPMEMGFSISRKPWSQPPEIKIGPSS